MLRLNITNDRIVPLEMMYQKGHNIVQKITSESNEETVDKPTLKDIIQNI